MMWPRRLKPLPKRVWTAETSSFVPILGVIEMMTGGLPDKSEVNSRIIIRKKRTIKGSIVLRFFEFLNFFILTPSDVLFQVFVMITIRISVKLVYCLYQNLPNIAAMVLGQKHKIFYIPFLNYQFLLS